jgi:hypothetical protein
VSGRPPDLGELDPETAARGLIVVLHAPRSADGTTTWLLSLVDLAGVVLAREPVQEHGVQALDTIVRDRLEALGRRVDGGWISDLDVHAEPRHRALLR